MPILKIQKISHEERWEELKQRNSGAASYLSENIPRKEKKMDNLRRKGGLQERIAGGNTRLSYRWNFTWSSR